MWVKIKFYALVIFRTSNNPFFNVSLLSILKIDSQSILQNNVLKQKKQKFMAAYNFGNN